MRKYCYEKIDKLLQPVMEMMREEFPNDCKLIVGTDFSKIVFEHTYLMLPSDEMKKPLAGTEIGKQFGAEMFDALKDMYKKSKKAEENSCGLKDN